MSSGSIKKRLMKEANIRLEKRYLKEAQYQAQMAGDGSDISHYPTCVSAHGIKPIKGSDGWSITIDGGNYYINSKVYKNGMQEDYHCSWENGIPTIKFGKEGDAANVDSVTTGAPTIPTELKDVEGVKKFQDWADTNKPGWATGFPEGKLNKGSGYGRFGPRTTKAWSQYQKDYLSQIPKI